MIAFITIAFAGIEIGRAFFTAQIMGEGARIAAREVATTPGSISTPSDPIIFDERYTVIDLDRLRDPLGGPFISDVDGDGDVDVSDLFQILPPLHISLRSVMIREDRQIGGSTRRLLRFPGALFRDTTAVLGEDLLVMIPDILAEGATTDVNLDRIVTLSYDPVTNIVRTETRFHYQFSVFMATSGTGGPLLPPVDPATVNILNPGILGPYNTPVDYGLGRPGTLRGTFRSGTIHIRQFGAARKEIP
jgi:hypothetical protein